MEGLEKIQKDIKYYNEKVYSSNLAITELEEKIRITQEKSDKINNLNLVIGGVGFLLYLLGHVISPIVSIIGLLIIPSMAIVYAKTTKLEKEIEGYKADIAAHKKDIELSDEFLNNLLDKQKISELINKNTAPFQYKGIVKELNIKNIKINTRGNR